MLPEKIRNALFDKLSGVTMRPFFTPLSARNVTGLAAMVLEQSERDFFVNGAITSHGACPELMAGLWSGGRETSLVDNELEAWLKKAMGAALSQENRCPYCEDMLLSLTHGAQEEGVAVGIRKRDRNRIEDPVVRARLDWARAAIDSGNDDLGKPLFTAKELPEAIGTILVFSYTNKISDFTMDGSPVPVLGRGASLRAFGTELSSSARKQLEPGASISLLPPADLPRDLDWASLSPLVADSLSRWSQVVDRNAADVLDPETIAHIRSRLAAWQGGHPPPVRAWVEADLGGLSGKQRDLARIAIIVAKASYQIDDKLLQGVVDQGVAELDLVKLGAFGAFSGARRVAGWVADAAQPVKQVHMATSAA